MVYDCPPPHTLITNRTTHFTFTVGNETVRQGVWFSTLDGCTSGQGTGIVLGDGCLIRDIFVEAVWERDGAEVMDRAPDAGGLTFDACPAQAERQAPNATRKEPGAATEATDAAQHDVPAGIWLGLVALSVAARRR